MKKIKSILLITILFLALLATTNSFAAEEFTLSKEYLTLLPELEYTITGSDDILNCECTILNEISMDEYGNYRDGNIYINYHFENNLVYVTPYIHYYAKDNEVTIKLSITSVNNETKDCIIHIPSVRSLLGVDSLDEIFLNNKVGKTINLKPKVDIDNTNYLYYTSTYNNYDSNYFFVIIDDNEVFKKNDDYTFEIKKIGQFNVVHKGGNYYCNTYTGSVFEFMSTEKIVLNKNEIALIELNSDYKFPIYALPSTTENNWIVENNNVLSFMDDLKVTSCWGPNSLAFFAKNIGTTKIIVKSQYDNHVIEKEVEVINPIKKINFDKISLELNEGETYNLVATITPNDATYKDLTWSSSNEKVATVDENGKIIAINSGVAVISAVGYGDIEERCVVKVNDPVKKITLDKSTLELNEGETYNLTATVTTTNEAYKKLTWLTSDVNIATVDENGKITAINSGIAVISAVGYGGKEEKCVVKVINPVKKITFDKTSLVLKKGENYNLTVTVTTTNEAYKKLTWLTSDDSIAIVDEKGKISAKDNGIAVITAVGHGGIEEKCVVLVKDDKPNNIIITTLPVTSNIKFAKNTLFNSIATVENFPILGYEGYGMKLYSSSGEEKSKDAVLGSKDIISIYDTEEVLTTYNVIVKGDVSGDGSVKIYDSFQILKGVLINEELDEVETEIRDYNDDGKVVIYDAFQYLKESILE